LQQDDYDFVTSDESRRRSSMIGGVKILVVEDDRKLGRFLQRVLSEEGYGSDLCISGASAIEMVRSGSYKLMILDWMIPEVDGLEVCRQLRRHGSSLPIIILTARGEPAERVMGLDAGADDYLVKPFEVDELLARVRALLRRSAGPARLALGPLVIDRDQRCALLGGILVDLTAREFNLLFHLAQHAGEVVSRGDLLNEVWSSALDPESNVVDVQISRLREKLGDAAGLVETVRGAGYRLSVPTK
jgi:DNA-binding response OmpR family regulator